MGKGFDKATVIKVAIAAVLVIALAVSMIFIFKGCNDDKKPTQGDVSSQSDVSSEDTSSETESDTSDSKANVFTVTFKDYDGTVLKTEKVEKGKSATAPASPKREHFTFAGWDKDFDNITADLVVTATYTTTKTVIYAESVTVNKGAKEATMNIRVINNPGIMGAVLKVAVDDKVLTFKEAKKTEFPSLTLTTPGAKSVSSPYTFMLDALELQSKDKKDGTLFTVTFNIKDNADTGKYKVELSYDKGAIFDEDYDDPKVVLENGTITVK